MKKFGAGKKNAEDKAALIGKPEEEASNSTTAAKKPRGIKGLIAMIDLRVCDVFGYAPTYTFPGFRSNFGGWSSVLLLLAVFLRVTTTFSDYVSAEPVVSENRIMFERDLETPFTLPKMGLVFKKTGWKPFYDPTYFRFRFQQGDSGRAANSTYEELEDQPCSFVDSYGRIIEDEARCPGKDGVILGNFFDASFRFVHISILRCHNGTDDDGRAKPGPCRPAEEIDELIWSGTVTLAVMQRDLELASSAPTTKLLLLKKQFISHVHPTYDIMFTVRFVTTTPRAYAARNSPLRKNSRRAQFSETLLHPHSAGTLTSSTRT